MWSNRATSASKAWVSGAEVSGAGAVSVVIGCDGLLVKGSVRELAGGRAKFKTCRSAGQVVDRQRRLSSPARKISFALHAEAMFNPNRSVKRCNVSDYHAEMNYVFFSVPGLTSIGIDRGM